MCNFWVINVEEWWSLKWRWDCLLTIHNQSFDGKNKSFIYYVTIITHAQGWTVGWTGSRSRYSSDMKQLVPQRCCRQSCRDQFSCSEKILLRNYLSSAWTQWTRQQNPFPCRRAYQNIGKDNIIFCWLTK